ncbi:hypothetical protein [Alteromonas lipolytica]|uniref:hypothetical protein n=1 Tax=Alteromonas lipolytica TaxID=1856405 RepID=UPI001665810A|nr:hypothetical protein [Alteromonas lipolytica]GGF52879.1 hypothetical protein GCM10011338_01220 [Alteromonas lipolytica]
MQAFLLSARCQAPELKVDAISFIGLSSNRGKYIPVALPSHAIHGVSFSTLRYATGITVAPHPSTRATFLKRLAEMQAFLLSARCQAPELNADAISLIGLLSNRGKYIPVALPSHAIHGVSFSTLRYATGITVAPHPSILKRLAAMQAFLLSAQLQNYLSPVLRGLSFTPVISKHTFSSITFRSKPVIPLPELNSWLAPGLQCLAA